MMLDYRIENRYSHGDNYFEADRILLIVSVFKLTKKIIHFMLNDFFHQKHRNDIDNAPKADAKPVCTVKSNISTKYQ